MSDRRAAASPEHAALSLSLRRELGLPVDARVVMSGHQAQFWHAGILAKAMASDALSRVVAAGGGRAARAWVVVDQDASDSAQAMYPQLASAQRGAGVNVGAGVEVGAGEPLPTQGTWAYAPAQLAAELRADCAIASLSGFEPGGAPIDAATTDVTRGLRAMRDVLARHHGAPSAAAQIASANAELLAGLLTRRDTTIPIDRAQSAQAGPLGVMFMASRLAGTSAFRFMLGRIADDPAACVGAYNEAVAALGRHDLTPLTFAPEKGRIELPLWQLAPVGKPGPRKRVFASTLGDVPVDRLAPRAIFMTALLRWLACDLFIHGTGGGASAVNASGGGASGGGMSGADAREAQPDADAGYDRAAELWMRRWLGVELAPSVVASATLVLPLGQTPATTQPQVLAAQHAAHAARHAPALLGDAVAQQRKDELVRAIATTTDRAQRRALYLRMHAVLADFRHAQAGPMDKLREEAQRSAEQLAAQRILHVRTWPWPLHPRARLLALGRAIDAAFGLPTGPVSQVVGDDA